MAVTQKYPILRWAVPAAAVAAIAAAAVMPLAGADPTLPPKTAEQLLVDVQNAGVDEFFGTVESSTDLGLPPLPGDSEFGSLMSGAHTVRVWHDGDDKSRLSLHTEGGEATVVRNGDELWQWSSDSKTAKHTVLPEHDHDGAPTHTPPTPQQAAEDLLAAIEPSTEVSVNGTARVAGRSAYLLVLDPKSDDTLVEQVTIAVDSETSAPLRVQVWSSGGAEPAISVGYTQVSFTTPDESVFDFTPPSGATVEEVTPGEHDKADKPDKPEMTPPTVVGEGWDRVYVATLPPMDGEPGTQPANPDAAEWEQFMEQLPTVEGDGWQGKALTSSLVTVVLTEDGRVALGMVPTERVVAAIP